MSTSLQCNYCGRKNFASSWALTQHLSKNPVCKEQSTRASLQGKSWAQQRSTRRLKFSTLSLPNKHICNSNKTGIDFNNSTVLDGNNVPICRNEYDHLLYNDQDDQGSLEDNNWLNDSDVSIEPNSDSNNGIENSLPIDSVRDNRLSFACGATVTIICKLESYFLAFRIYFVKIGKYFALQTHYLLQTSIFCFVAL